MRNIVKLAVGLATLSVTLIRLVRIVQKKPENKQLRQLDAQDTITQRQNKKNEARTLEFGHVSIYLLTLLICVGSVNVIASLFKLMDSTKALELSHLLFTVIELAIGIALYLKMHEYGMNGTSPSHAAAPASSEKEVHIPPLLIGKWIKLPERCTSMAGAMTLMQLNPIMRTAINLIRGVEIRVKDNEFDLVVFSFISWFRITERYSLSGEPSYCKRRDFRRGQHEGWLADGPGGAVLLTQRWGEPLSGVAIDTFLVTADGNEMSVRSELTVGGTTVVNTMIYRRAK